MKTEVNTLERLNKSKSIKITSVKCGQDDCERLLGAFENPKGFSIQIVFKCL